MIKLKKKKKTAYELDLYEAKVEEALAKWEFAKKSETSQNTEPPRPRKK